MTQFSEIALWLFAITHGVAFGAGLYEQRIVVPIWFELTRVNSEAMRTIDTGRRFWGFVSTGPLTLLTLINLWLAWSSNAPVHDWWLAAGVITLAERIFTFGYFIPNAIKLMRADTTLSADRALAKAAQWRTLNWLRLALSLAAWIGALKALTLLSA